MEPFKLISEEQSGLQIFSHTLFFITIDVCLSFSHIDISECFRDLTIHLM